MYQTISATLIAAVTLGLAAYDVLPMLSAKEGDMISQVLRTWSRDWPILAYLWGVLSGHFFLGHEQAITTPVGDFWLVIWSCWLGLILNLWYRDASTDAGLWAYMALLVAGCVVGHFFWSQA